MEAIETHPILSFVDSSTNKIFLETRQQNYYNLNVLIHRLYAVKKVNISQLLQCIYLNSLDHCEEIFLHVHLTLELPTTHNICDKEIKVQDTSRN